MQRLLNFDVSIQPRTGGYYTCVAASPTGEAHADFALPFSDQELQILVLQVLASVGRIRRKARRIQSQDRQLLEDFGSQLFQAVFSGAVRNFLDRSLATAESKNAGLRIRLRLPPELANIPWEYLYDRESAGFVGLSPETVLLRYVEMPRPPRPFPISPPLRILTMISAPSDVPELQGDEEWAKLNAALTDLSDQGMVQADRLEVGTLAALQRPLRRREYHVLHFVGHGMYDENAQDGALALEAGDGRTRLVTGRDLGMMLKGHPSLRLVVLNACEGARSAQDDPFGGVAQALVRQGIPAVIAMQFEISDPAALVFSQSFYQAIADGLPVDLAMVEARKTMFAEGNEVEWATPVLYLRSPDGQVFVKGRTPKADRQTQEEAEQKAREEAEQEASLQGQEDADYLDTQTDHDADQLPDVTQPASVTAPGGTEQSPPKADPENLAVSLDIRRDLAPLGHPVQTNLTVGQNDSDRAARLIGDSERTAQSITDEYRKVRALAAIAKVLAATDPERATRLFGDAERTAHSVPNTGLEARGFWATRALAEVAKALVASNPDRAERIARSITDEPQKAWALAEVAQAMAVTDPDRATRLFGDAERLAQSATAKDGKALVHPKVAKALVARAPGRAERIARSITDESNRAQALLDVAQALAVTDPDRATRLFEDAERTADCIPDDDEWWGKSSKTIVLINLAGALAVTDPDRATRLMGGAERTAQSIEDESERAGALLDVAKALATSDQTARNASPNPSLTSATGPGRSLRS